MASEGKQIYRRYVTTSGNRYIDKDPQPPDAICDWKMVGAAAAGDYLYWFWMLEWEQVQ